MRPIEELSTIDIMTFLYIRLESCFGLTDEENSIKVGLRNHPDVSKTVKLEEVRQQILARKDNDIINSTMW